MDGQVDFDAVGRRLERARLRAGLSRARLAANICDPHTIYKYERRGMGMHAEKLAAFAGVLGVSSEWLMYGKEGEHGDTGTHPVVTAWLAARDGGASLPAALKSALRSVPFTALGIEPSPEACMVIATGLKMCKRAE